jgi:hypothetical protein
MTAEPDKSSRSSPQPVNELLKFSIPEYEDVEIVLLRDKKGNIVSRTAKELEKR